MLTIDKSVFTAEERAQYEALIAKASVDPEAAGESMEDDKPPFPPKKKKTEKAEVKDLEKSVAPEIQTALERLERLEKSIEMQGYNEIAKKYAPALGEKEEELAKTLYELKKSSESNYDAYIAILEKSLSLVNKSGLFEEIGKSARGFGVAKSDVLSQIEAKAEAIMKNDPAQNRSSAIAKAWEENPELAIQYEIERGR